MIQEVPIALQQAALQGALNMLVDTNHTRKACCESGIRDLRRRQQGLQSKCLSYSPISTFANVLKIG